MNFSLLKRHENNAFCVNINMWRRNGVVYAANKSVSLSLCIFCIIKKTLFFLFTSVSDSKYGRVEASDLTFCKSTFSKNEKVYSFTFCQIKKFGRYTFFFEFFSCFCNFVSNRIYGTDLFIS